MNLKNVWHHELAPVNTLFLLQQVIILKEKGLCEKAEVKTYIFNTS